MRHLSDRLLFSQTSNAAPGVFAYVDQHVWIGKLPLEFEYAVLDETGARVAVKFSCRPCDHCRDGVIWVSARLTADGNWAFAHTVGWLS